MAIGKKTGGRDWVKGQSGNPEGRPKEGQSLTEILLSNISKEELATELARRLRDSPSDYLLRFIYNHIDGMPVQKQVHIGEEEQPVRLIIQDERKKNAKTKTD